MRKETKKVQNLIKRKQIMKKIRYDKLDEARSMLNREFDN